MAQLSGEIRGGSVPFYSKLIPKAKKLAKTYKKPKKKVNYGQAAQNTAKRNNPAPKKNYGQAAQNTAKRNNPAPKRNYGQAAQNTRYTAPKKKSSGGAVGQGGRVYKNGYVDSKGNKVVNGRWVSPKKQSPTTKNYSAPKKASYSAPKKSSEKILNKGNVAKVAPAVVKAPVVKKTAAQLKAEREAANKKYLAGDTQYQNELGGLKDALARYNEQNSADTGTLRRSYNSQAGKGGSIEKNRKKSQVGNSEGFAMRGMLRSGGYSDQATDINNTYKEQRSRVTDAYNDDKGRLSRAKSAEGETVNQKREQARVAALSRKANQEVLKAQASSQ